MEKIITISKKDFKIKSSAFTPFAYKNETGRDLIKDINKINKLNNEISEIADEKEKNERWLDEITGILELVLKMAFIMIKEADKTISNYDDWLKGLDDVMSDTKWLNEVMEVGLAPLSGQLQGNQNK